MGALDAVGLVDTLGGNVGVKVGSYVGDLLGAQVNPALDLAANR